MIIKGLVDEDFINYKLPSMYLIFPSCSFKCDKENGGSYCQNSSLLQYPDIEITKREVCERYLQNPITKAVVCGGLEPFDTLRQLAHFIRRLREDYQCNDDVVIYTGYTQEEIENKIYWEDDMSKFFIDSILKYPNIIIKYGRFIPNEKPHFDEILGIELASNNQYAVEYNKE